MRTFLIPMTGPAAGGKGTREDPWRPKYIREANLRFASRGNLRFAMLCEVQGPDADLEMLAAQPDVIELATGRLSADTQEKLAQALFECASRAGVSIPIDTATTATAGEFSTAILKYQQQRTPAEDLKILVALKVRDGP